ncbi:MAG: class I poly(R)-hydroxyalkanoic acid synthase [Candidatus Eremiobacteraeota bacterium]|nr:class I poly(R)-hydroxyalkanoic acid synthase [Candidatus Eremiobacteraeota bacterium]
MNAEPNDSNEQQPSANGAAVSAATEVPVDGAEPNAVLTEDAVVAAVEATLPAMATDGMPPPPGPAAANGAGTAGATEAVPNPFDPLGIGKATYDVWQKMMAHPESLMAGQAQFANAWMNVATRSRTPKAEQTAAIIEPAAGDGRFKHPAWSDNPTFDALKQGYLLACKAVLDAVDNADVDPGTKARVKFFTKQFCGALSPTNFPFFNPAVIEETMRTGGANLTRGVANVFEDMRDNAGRPALVDKKAFTVGRNVATTPGNVVYRNKLIELIEYTPTTGTVYEKPLVIVPPWINKYYILDLQPKNSLIKFAVDNGIRTYVVSWRNPDKKLDDMGWEDYAKKGPQSAARVASAISESHDVNMIGYCIGGTLTAESLAYLAKSEETLVNAVTFFAALTDFAEAGDLQAFLSPEAVASLEKNMKKKGVLDSSEMADTFNMLRSNDLIWNVAVNRYLLGKDAPAFDLLYWNGDATRLPCAMHSYYLRNMYLENNLAKPNTLSLEDVPIDLRTVKNDVFCLATAEDHIAPWRSVYKMTQMFSGDVRFRLGHSGHIAGIVNPPGSGKGHYWQAAANPPTADAWLAGASKSEGSWWPEWMEWLQARSGAQGLAPEQPGNKHFPALDPAPGTYVLEQS